MAQTTIEWTATRSNDGSVIPGYTFNHVRGCTKVSDGCKFCYADTLSKRNPGVLGVWGPKGTRVVAAESYWRQPIRWNADAAAAGERRKVFCASLADVFEGPETMPRESWEPVQQARARLWALIEQTPALDWLLLTKRPHNAAALAPEAWEEAWPDNAWLGTSIENQAAATVRIPHLLKVPARIRFLSCEPLLGPVDLAPWIGSMYCSACSYRGEEVGPNEDERGDPDCPRCGADEWHFTAAEWHGGLDDDSRRPLHWIIAGGESGPQARPAHPDWFRSLRDQCAAAGVAFHFKQHGEYVHAGDCPPDARRHPTLFCAGGTASTVTLYRPGKHAAGRLLDGVEHNEVPT